MAYRLLFSTYEITRNQGCNHAAEVVMNLMNNDTSKCDRAEKEVVEGLCLSYDMLKGICLETMQECVAIEKDD